MKKRINRTAIFIFYALLLQLNPCYAQKLISHELDTVKLDLKPIDQRYIKLKKIFVTTATEEDTSLIKEMVSQIDLNRYTLVANREDAELVFVFTPLYQNKNDKLALNTKSVNYSKSNSPGTKSTSKSTSRNRNDSFKSNKTAFQNLRTKTTNTQQLSNFETNTSSGSYRVSGATVYETLLEVFDSTGTKVYQQLEKVEIVSEGVSHRSVEIAQTECDEQVKRNLLLSNREFSKLLMNRFVSIYFFASTEMTLYDFRVKNKKFEDWNLALEAMQSWVKTSNHDLNDSRIQLIRNVLEGQTQSDFSTMKNGVNLKAASFYNLAVFEYYCGNSKKAMKLLGLANFDNEDFNRQKKSFLSNLYLSLMRNVDI